MEVVEHKTGNIYSITIHGTRLKQQMLCPSCSHTRKKNKDKCMTWNAQKQTGKCFHCEAFFYPYKEKQMTDYTPIPWTNKTRLSDQWVKFFEDRRISQGTLTKMQISESEKGALFPFFKGGEAINIKSRTLDKNFELVKGKPLIFYNYDAILEYDSIIITEGEIDALSFIECGFENVISVPNGANAGMPYLESALPDLDRVETFYLAVDNDSAGLVLRNELQRRLGIEKCLIVDFGLYKDANEYLINEGGAKFKDILTHVKEPTIEGVVCAEDFYEEIRSLMENGLQPGKTIGLPKMDEVVTWETGRLAIFTGIPSHGKSEFVDFLTVRLFQKHGWRTAYFTPENYPLQYHYSKIFSKLTGKAFTIDEHDALTFTSTYETIQDNFFWIDPKDDITIEAIIERAKYLVKFKGIKVLVIDPFNKLEHSYGKSQSETQYISHFLDKLTSFAKRYDILAMLVAHPVKMQKDKDGTYLVPGLYDISGSANFYNKADYGVTIYRNYDFNNHRLGNDVRVHVQKIKFKHLGSTGIVDLQYNYRSGTYY